MIITKGFGNNQRIIARGFGFLARLITGILSFVTSFLFKIRTLSPFFKTDIERLSFFVQEVSTDSEINNADLYKISIIHFDNYVEKASPVDINCYLDNSIYFEELLSSEINAKNSLDFSGRINTILNLDSLIWSSEKDNFINSIVIDSKFISLLVGE